MKKIVLICGLISGAIVTSMMLVTAERCVNGTFDTGEGEVIGYTSMIVAFITIFIGIRTYRERTGGGAITFGKGFQIGILITLIACTAYVAAWEFVYHKYFPNFEDSYATHVVAKMQRDGEPDAKIAAKTKELEEFKRLYKNPVFNVGMTFLEIFPVGLIVTLVSAAILRKRPALATVSS